MNTLKSASYTVLCLLLLTYVGGQVVIALFSLINPAWLVWEGDTRNFLSKEKPDLVSYFKQLLVWKDVLVSTPQNSLVYGATLFLLSSLQQARLASLFWILTFCFFSVLINPNSHIKWAVFLFLLHPVVIFYSTYGVAVSVAVGLSFLITSLVMVALNENYKKSLYLFLGIVISVSFYEYVPVRFVAIFTLLFLGIVLLKRKRLVELALLAVFPLACTIFNLFLGRLEFFYSARGEQIINFFNHPDYLKEYIGTVERKPENFLSLLYTLIRHNFWDLLKHFNIDYSAIVTHDPPSIPLLVGIYSLLFILGLLRLFGRNALFAGYLLYIIISISFLLLLTTRVDTHRISVLVAPVTVVTAFALDFLYDNLSKHVGYKIVLACIGFVMYFFHAYLIVKSSW